MEVLARFAAALWEPGDIIELRAIHPAKDRGALSVWSDAGRLTECAEWGNKRNLDGFGIYAGANPRKDRGKSAADVALARCLFVDFDGVDVGTATALVADKCLPLPTVVVASGHGCHCWWRLAEPMTDLAEWSGRQQALIRLLGSDDKIKDAPRVMRCPGWWNTKDPRVLADLVECEPSRVYGLDQFPEAVAAARGITGAPTLNGSAANLSRNTLLFVATGAAEGERNDRLFKAAADFAGNGLDEGTAEARLLPVAVGCGLAEAEARQTIRSAYARPRTPARPVREGPVDEQDWGEADGGQVSSVGARPRFGNVKVEPREVADGNGGVKVVEAIVYQRVDEVGTDLRDMTNGWPKSVGGLPFVVKGRPEKRSVRILQRTPDLFAWIGEVTEPYWTEKACYAAEGGKRTPPTKEEFYAHIKSSGDQYSAVSILPHWPLVDGVYYLPIDLPEVENGPDGRPMTPALDEFCEKLNADSEDDRQLLRAQVITQFWGGPCGGRPAFALCSEHGKGSGKTSTAEAIAALAGGHFAVGAKEEWSQTSKRLMSDRAMQSRTILIDNVKGRLGGQEIESLITSNAIDGWRSYHGDFSRPNLSMVVITSNTPTLTRDLATRTVLIKIGRQRHGQSFLVWAADFQRRCGLQVVAECIAVLKSDPVSAVSPQFRDRWQAWQDGVLSRFPNADALAALIADRRDGVDADTEDAAGVAKAIVDWLRGKSLDPGKGVHKITRDELRDLLLKTKIIDEGLGKRAVHTWIGNLLGSDGPLAALKDGPRQSDGMCWLWVGSAWKPTNEDLPPV